MKVKVNGKEVETQAQNIASLIEELKLPQRGIALGVNKRMVPQSQWADHSLDDGMDITIIKAACGG